ncbi:tricin synthase 1-like isoform X1 [Miscanthus floridulus]|uniref:tricin synthase 1-like isoform X1 n=1 Tax=Miscanthus floridulus TaxID=154761 RepID=UPI00345A53BE
MASTGVGEGNKTAAGSSLHSKTLLKSQSLYEVTHPKHQAMFYPTARLVRAALTDYLGSLRLVHTGIHRVPARAGLPEGAPRRHRYPPHRCRAGMAASPDEVQLLGLLIEMLGTKNAVEVGVFTGYSLLATALALPDDGKIVAIDVTRESYDQIGSPVTEKAGVAHKIDFRVGLALPVLDQMVAEEGNKDRFDFAFVDADKVNFLNYHERLLQLVRVGGLIAYDNTLWQPLSERDRALAAATREFNAAMAADPRVHV